MVKMEVAEHQSLFEYRDTMTRIIKSIYPHMDIDDIERAVEYSMSKRFKDFELSIQNNYTNKILSMSALEMLDYIAKRQPIITSYGTMFKRHGDVPNPMGKVIQNFLDLRKKHKKEMFKYPKGSEMFERYNLLQALDKIDANGIYGVIGLYLSFLFDLNVAPAVTSTGRSLISSAILCFEGFLGNNVKFGSLNDILIFIDNIRMEYKDWKYDDFDVLGYDGFVTIDECFNKLIMNCGYKYIPTEQDMDIVYKIVQNCNQKELNRIFYKNNLYCFMDLPVARNLMIKIVTGMKTPYIEPAKPPKEIIQDLDILRDYLVEYVFYCHQYIDRMMRNKEMVKMVSVVSDTDSSFVSLDAWYNYNIAYLKDYDCPIIHQQIDVFNWVEKEMKDEYWKDREIPEWLNAEGKSIAIRYLETDEFGDVKDKSELQAIEYLDDKLDYDFYNQEIIEQKRAVDMAKIIPQDNMKFALVNIMCYVLSTVINLYMLDFTKHSGSFRGEEFCKINMKNEFYMSRIMLTFAKKNYASLQKLQEGNYLGESGVLDAKGIECLTKSSISRDTQKALKKILLEDILACDEIDQIKLIKDIAILEKTIYNDLKSGSKKYYKPAVIKSMDNYDEPTRIQGVKAAMAWNHIKGDLPGFNLGDRNAIDIIKVKMDKAALEKMKEDNPDHYDSIMELLDPNCDIYCEGRRIKDVYKGKLDAIALPKDLPVPEWVKPLIDYDEIINNNLSGFPLKSVGIAQFSSKKANYSNVVKL